MPKAKRGPCRWIPARGKTAAGEQRLQPTGCLGEGLPQGRRLVPPAVGPAWPTVSGALGEALVLSGVQGTVFLSLGFSLALTRPFLQCPLVGKQPNGWAD